MIDDVYQLALTAVRHHLDEAGTRYTLDDGEVLVGGHRLGLSIAFDSFEQQGAHVLAPLDIQIHVDGDSGDRFRVGILGVGDDRTSALTDAVAEWHLLALGPVLAALGAQVDTLRGSGPISVGGWDLFPGRVGIRGEVPAQLRAGGAFYRTLVDAVRQVVAKWQPPGRFMLRSIFAMATVGSGNRDIQAAIDGLVSDEVQKVIAGLPWPESNEAYLYKQLFVLRHQPAE